MDVINFSISGTSTNFRDPVEIAWLFAADAGVFVAASAGNSGPTTSDRCASRARGSRQLLLARITATARDRNARQRRPLFRRLSSYCDRARLC